MILSRSLYVDLQLKSMRNVYSSPSRVFYSRRYDAVKIPYCLWNMGKWISIKNYWTR